MLKRPYTRKGTETIPWVVFDLNTKYLLKRPYTRKGTETATLEEFTNHILKLKRPYTRKGTETC